MTEWPVSTSFSPKPQFGTNFGVPNKQEVQSNLCVFSCNYLPCQIIHHCISFLLSRTVVSMYMAFSFFQPIIFNNKFLFLEGLLLSWHIYPLMKPYPKKQYHFGQSLGHHSKKPNLSLNFENISPGCMGVIRIVDLLSKIEAVVCLKEQKNIIKI